MAFDKKPSTWLNPGYTVASHVAGFNTNDATSNKLLKQITDANADPTTGDIRILAMAICEALHQAWVGQAGSQPTRMTISRTITGQGNSVTFTYTLKFTVQPDTFEVIAE